jgi:hypothetical protein
MGDDAQIDHDHIAYNWLGMVHQILDNLERKSRPEAPVRDCPNHVCQQKRRAAVRCDVAALNRAMMQWADRSGIRASGENGSRGIYASWRGRQLTRM